MPFPNYFYEVAKARMMDEFYSSGHTSIEQKEPDTSHPHHDLFLDTQQLVSEYCPVSGSWGVDSYSLDQFRDEKYEQLLSARSLDAMNGVLEIPDTLEIYRGDNVKIIELLTKCNALHLWQVPRPANTEARIAAVSGVSQASDTNGTPTDPDSSIKAALKAGLAAAERKVSAIQDTKRDLKSRLAVVEEAETAVLGAQKAMEKSDTALLQSLMSLLAMDNY